MTNPKLRAAILLGKEQHRLAEEEKARRRAAEQKERVLCLRNSFLQDDMIYAEVTAAIKKGVKFINWSGSEDHIEAINGIPGFKACPGVPGYIAITWEDA